jgi:hypothetical protein
LTRQDTHFITVVEDDHVGDFTECRFDVDVALDHGLKEPAAAFSGDLESGTKEEATTVSRSREQRKMN